MWIENTLLILLRLKQIIVRRRPITTFSGWERENKGGKQDKRRGVLGVIISECLL